MESNPENVNTSSSNEGKNFTVEPLRLSEEEEFNNPTVESCGPHSSGRYIEAQDDNFKDKSVKERERCETSPHGLARLCSMSLRRVDNSPNKTGSHTVLASELLLSLPVDQPTSAQCNSYVSSFPSDEMSEDTVGSVETTGKVQPSTQNDFLSCYVPSSNLLISKIKAKSIAPLGFVDYSHSDNSNLNLSNNFMCTTCKKKFGCLYDLETHHQMFPHKCPYCCYCLTKRKYLSKHFKKKHSLEASLPAHTYSCNVCDRKFAQKYLLDMHLTKNHSVQMLFQCDICSEILKSETSLKRHIAFHSEQRTCYKCTKCGDVFASKTGLSCHGKTHKDHPSERCDECGKIFSSVCISHSHKSSHHGEHSKKGNCNICDKKVFNLYHHKLRFHGKEVQYQCETCGKYFPNTVLFQDHLKIHLNRTARSYPCDMCARIFSSRVSLQGHKDRHKGYKRYLCDVCGMGFVTPQNFRQHKFTHEDHRPYKCKLCKFSAAQKISLHTHTKLHLKPKANLDPMRYRRNVMIPCEVCDEKFSCITSLKKHKTSVHGEKYYKCEHCGYSTGWQANYIKHLKVHSGVRPYVCHICDYSSVFRNNLKRHMKTHGNTLSSNLFSV